MVRRHESPPRRSQDEAVSRPGDLAVSRPGDLASHTTPSPGGRFAVKDVCREGDAQHVADGGPVCMVPNSVQSFGPFEYTDGKPACIEEDRGYVTPCWLFVRGRANELGRYGKYRGRPAHVVSWEAVNGPIPAGMHADHRCRQRACVRPDHIEPVPPMINVMRGAVCNPELRPHGPYKRPWNWRDYQPDEPKRGKRRTNDEVAAERRAKANAARIATGLAPLPEPKKLTEKERAERRNRNMLECL